MIIEELADGLGTTKLYTFKFKRINTCSILKTSTQP